jgi:DNA-binding YbaB/EbfC family protein
MANFLQMAQKAAQLKSRMQDLQERIGEAEITGAAGNGLVTCVIDGKFALKKLKVDPSLSGEIMEDLVIAAVANAREKAEQLVADETKKLMDDLGLPPGLGLPF